MQKLNKIRRNWFVASLALEMLWLFAVSLDDFSISGIDIKNQKDSNRQVKSNLAAAKWTWNLVSVVVLGSVNVVIAWFSFRHEIKTKYTAIF